MSKASANFSREEYRQRLRLKARRDVSPTPSYGGLLLFVNAKSKTEVKCDLRVFSTPARHCGVYCIPVDVLPSPPPKRGHQSITAWLADLTPGQVSAVDPMNTSDWNLSVERIRARTRSPPNGCVRRNTAQFNLNISLQTFGMSVVVSLRQTLDELFDSMPARPVVHFCAVLT